MSMREFITFADYMRVISWDLYNPQPPGINFTATSAWYDRLRDHRDIVLREKFYLYLRDSVARGAFKPIANHCNREHMVVHSWNHFLSGAFDIMDEVVGNLYHAVTVQILSSSTVSDCRQAYEEFVTTFDTYDYPWHWISLSSNCDYTGEYIRINIRDGVPYWGKVNAGLFVEMPMMNPEVGYREFEIDLPTGELLCCDFPRVGLFNTLIDYRGSLSTRHGQIARTNAFAAKGVIHIMADNCSVYAFSPESNQNRVVFNRGNGDRYEYDTDSANPSYRDSRAYICCDMWTVSVVDRKTLHDLLEPRHGDRTSRLISDWIDDHVVDTIHVSPGKYKVTYHTQDNLLKSRPDIDWMGLDHPYFELTKID